MKKTICIALVTIILMLANSLPGYADRGGRGGHHGGHGGFGVSIGPVWGPGWWGPYYPYYPYYPYSSYSPYYAEPPAVAPQQPDVYIQPAPQSEEPDYWYYCQNPEGYYPYVKQCPKGWMRVVPSPPPADQGE
jgi:hypothetical protein